jgi:hypothetical protein
MKTLDRRHATASSLFLAFPYSFAQGIWRHFDTMKVESNSGREGVALKKISFADVKLDLEEACEFLRSFTLGRDGFTQKDGLAGIQRVTEHCNRMEKLFADGPDATKSKTLVALARPKISAAEARLAVLRKN